MKAVIARTSRPSAFAAEALWRRWKDDKDMASRNRLVMSYAPMVKYLAVRKVRRLEISLVCVVHADAVPTSAGRQTRLDDHRDNDRRPVSSAYR